MKSNNSWRIKLSHLLLGATIAIALLVARGTKAGDGHAPLVTDWSHHHVIFSAPRSLMERFRWSRSPRYVQQWLRRNAGQWDYRDEWRWRHAPEHPRDIHGDWSVDLGPGATVGGGNYPAKYSFSSTTANCATDYVVYNTSLAGSSSQATIAAFNNLYSSCNGGAPTTYWAFNTGTTGAVVTSPLLSGDGSQVAFIQNTGGAPNLVLVRWASGSGTIMAPTTLTGISASAYYNSGTGCTAPCMTTIAFSTANSDAPTADNFSSPFYDFTNDVLYVGDNDGYLHKFINVFKGTPSEEVCTSTTAPAPCTAPAGTDIWPASLATPFNLNSPVLGEGEPRILVTDRVGFFYSVDPNIGGVFSGSSPASGNFIFSAKLADTGFDDGPLLDATTDDVYLFAREDNSGTTEAAVIQIPLSVFADNVGLATPGVTKTVISGTTLPATALYIGTFDNIYEISAGGTGHLYTCGVTPGGDNLIYQISITTGTMSTTPTTGPTLTNADVACSPPTEFYNGTTDQLYMSVANSALTSAQINCPSNTLGCILAFNITNGTWTTSTSSTAATGVTSGTSGIIVDNSVPSGTLAGASQVYFTPLANQSCTTAVTGGYAADTSGGCAIQASQSTLGE